MLEIAVFGRISTGKSALLNAVFSAKTFAVDPRGGTTKKTCVKTITYRKKRLKIIDTPGIGEVSGEKRAGEARRAAHDADLILFVCDRDISNFEYTEIRMLSDAGKPLIVVLNKSDVLTQKERQSLLRHIRKRLSKYIDSQNILVCAADPLHHHVFENLGGTIQEVIKRAKPDVDKIRRRLIKILYEEADALQDIDIVEKQRKQTEKKRSRMKKNIEHTIDDYAFGVAGGVAANPVPLLDLFGGGAVIAALISRLANFYKVSMSKKEIANLTRKIIKEGWPQLWKAAIPIVGGAILKSIPVVGWLIGAIGQATGAYYITYIVGMACSEYFANNKQWAVSLKDTLKHIIETTDRNSVCQRAAKEIKKKLGG